MVFRRRATAHEEPKRQPFLCFHARRVILAKTYTRASRTGHLRPDGGHGGDGGTAGERGARSLKLGRVSNERGAGGSTRLFVDVGRLHGATAAGGNHGGRDGGGANGGEHLTRT